VPQGIRVNRDKDKDKDKGYEDEDGVKVGIVQSLSTGVAHTCVIHKGARVNLHDVDNINVD